MREMPIVVRNILMWKVYQLSVVVKNCSGGSERYHGGKYIYYSVKYIYRGGRYIYCGGRYMYCGGRCTDENMRMWGIYGEKYIMVENILMVVREYIVVRI